jgi:alanine racemase
VAGGEAPRAQRFKIHDSSLWFGVDSIVEALRLRRDGIRNPILVLGYTLPSRFRDAKQKKITITISHLEGIRGLAKSASKPDFHLKFDTGMHRHGFLKDDLEKLIVILKENNLRPSGAYSHLAAADNRSYSKHQRTLFEQYLGALREAGIRPKIIHFNKTEGILFYPWRDTMMRLGIGLYGYLPEPRSGAGLPRVTKKFIRPVLTWKTVVSEVKHVRSGERIGYDLTYRFSRDAVIAVLPIGYWHGYDRGLSNIGEVLIHGKRARIRGRVCMDIMMVEVTGISNVRIGDEVVLIGRQGSEFVSADEIGRKIGTESYEILTRINPLIRRIAV